MVRMGKVLPVIAWILLFGAACGPAVLSPTETAAPTDPPTATLPPTATPIPVFVLIAADQPATPSDALAIRAFEEEAQRRGAMIQRTQPGTDALAQALARRPAAVFSIAAGLGNDLTAAASAHPDVRFAAVNEPGAQASSNLLAVGGDYLRAEEAAFMAGLMAGVVNRNNRIGWIGGMETALDLRYRNGFIHGVRVTCPVCLVYSSALLPEGGAMDVEATLAYLLGTYIDTASAAPGSARDAALVRLAGLQARVVGTRDGFFENVFDSGALKGSENVVGAPAYRPDLLLREALPAFLDGGSESDPLWYSLESGGLELDESSNPWISSGKRAFLEELLAEIAAGRLSIGVDPETGKEF